MICNAFKLCSILENITYSLWAGIFTRDIRPSLEIIDFDSFASMYMYFYEKQSHYTEYFHTGLKYELIEHSPLFADLVTCVQTQLRVQH